MPGYSITVPRRQVVDEIISTGNTQPSGVTGLTTKSYGTPRYNSWASPLPPSTSAAILAATVSSSNGTTTLSSFLQQPDYARAVAICASTSQLASGNVSVVGTNQFGVATTDTIALGGAGAVTVNGVVPFKTITSIVLPAATSRNAGTSGAAPSITVGLTGIFGLDRTVDTVCAIIRGAKNGTAETTAPIINATYETVSFTNAATSSAGALMEVVYLAQDVVHI